MINKLVTEIKKKDAPVVVGLDPMLGYVPEHLTKKAFEEFGETLEGAAEAIWQYNKGIVDAVYDLIPAVKPQIAMYEQFGLEGVAVFQKTVRYCKEKGLIVIGDIKRGDIGSTSEAYAVGHLGQVKVGNTTGYVSKDYVSDTKTTTTRGNNTSRTENNTEKTTASNTKVEKVSNIENTTKSTESIKQRTI